jgi:8-oxo-dGTP diphosphatase
MASIRTLCFLWKGEPPTELLLGLKKTGLGTGKYLGFGGGVEVERGETIRDATIRELEEECGLRASAENLDYVGRLEFIFPEKSGWDQVVHVFVARVWDGEPAESDEMRPAWVAADKIPYESMWADFPHWFPQILAGERVQGTFVYKADNETLDRFTVGPLESDL